MKLLIILTLKDLGKEIMENNIIMEGIIKEVIISIMIEEIEVEAGKIEVEAEVGVEVGIIIIINKLILLKCF